MDLFVQINALNIQLRRHSALPHAELAILGIISRVGPLTVPQIARERSTSRQNIQILVDRLVADGRLELRGNPAHKRSTLVRLTESGRLWLEVGQKDQTDWLLDAGYALAEDEIRAATGVLGRVRDLLSAGQHMEKAERAEPAKPASKDRETHDPETTRGPESPEEEFPLNLL